MRYLVLDFETESEEDIKLGPYAYCIHPSTEVMCLSWRFIDEPVGSERVWFPDLYGDTSIPDELAQSLASNDRWWAFNAFFERCAWEIIMVQRWGWPAVPFDKWWCAAALAAYYGYAQQLETCCDGMHLDVGKDTDGGALMKSMMTPGKRSKKVIEAWDDNLIRLGEYCKDDVAAEAEIIKSLPAMPEAERKLWLLDQDINWRGIPLDRKLIVSAAAINETIQSDARKRLPVLTNGAIKTPGQIAKIKTWIEEQTGEALYNLRAPTVEKLLDDELIEPAVEEVLQIRQDAGTAAIKKFKKMKAAIDNDPTSRFRGGYMHYGAHTGRPTGKIVQPTNMPRAHFNSGEEVERAASAIVSGDLARVKGADEYSLKQAKAYAESKGKLWTAADEWRPTVTNTLTKTVRSSVTAPDGKVFVANDFSGIELRALTWYVKDMRNLDRIVKHGSSQLYLDMATKIFKRRVTKDDTFRYTTGKSARLGCGYNMGSYRKNSDGSPHIDEEGNPHGGFMDYAKSYGINLTCELADEAVNAYREDNPLVVKSWSKLYRRFKSVLLEGFAMSFNGVRISRVRRGNTYSMVLKLPSGRELWYPDVRIKRSKGRDTIVYKAYIKKKWVDAYLYGGLILENIIQGMSRDLHMPAMLKVNEKYPVVMHCYDEIASEVFEHEAEECDRFMKKVMCQRQSWCKDLPLDVEGWISRRYKK
jgi:DNA polymerase bacteriophage-type